MARKKKIYVGTSGWHYDHWRGPFYPEDLSKERFLEYYVGRLGTVEINNTFYQMPEKKTFTQWRKTVPEDFVFAVKASRYITHMKKLKDPVKPLSNFFKGIEVLQDRLGPILFQLPPRWSLNLNRLESFLKALPSGYRYSFEFRDQSWFDSQAYELLEAHNAAFCIYDLDRRISPKQVTADLVYVRLHGPGAAYQGKYTKRDLAGWAGAFSTWWKQGKDVFCYFDNDQAGYAVQNAVELNTMLN
jgi:uncharacterized protein YecE (DUF72 family)